MKYTELSPESKRKAAEYKKQHLKRIPLDVPKELYARVRQAANHEGMAVNTWLKALISKELEKLGM